MTVSVKSLQKQLIAAVAMVLVAMIALGSSTYAWFVSNNTVKATTSTISAQSNSPFLMIDKSDITPGSTTAISFTDIPEAKLYPAQVVKDTAEGANKNKPLFQSAYASAANAADILGGSRYDVAHAAETYAVGPNFGKEIVTTSEYAIKESFVIGTADPKAGSFKNLKVSKVELVGTSGLSGALSVLVVCNENWAVYKASETGTVLTKYSDGTTSAEGNNTDGVLAAAIPGGTSVNVDVYVFYDGSEDNVYTDNLANLTAIGATISFAATPVNTQGADVNVTNSVSAPTATASFTSNTLSVDEANKPANITATAYAWRVVGSDIVAGYDRTLSLTNASMNGNYTCTVTYTTAPGTTTTVTSNAVAATYDAS